MMSVDMFDPWFHGDMSTNEDDETMMKGMIFIYHILDESCTQRNTGKLSESTSYDPEVYTCGVVGFSHTMAAQARHLCISLPCIVWEPKMQEFTMLPLLSHLVGPVQGTQKNGDVAKLVFFSRS